MIFITGDTHGDIRRFFGHHHIDKVISAEEICIFEQIV